MSKKEEIENNEENDKAIRELMKRGIELSKNPGTRCLAEVELEKEQIREELIKRWEVKYDIFVDKECEEEKQKHRDKIDKFLEEDYIRDHKARMAEEEEPEWFKKEMAEHRRKLRENHLEIMSNYRNPSKKYLMTLNFLDQWQASKLTGIDEELLRTFRRFKVGPPYIRLDREYKHNQYKPEYPREPLLRWQKEHAYIFSSLETLWDYIYGKK